MITESNEVKNEKTGSGHLRRGVMQKFFLFGGQKYTEKMEAYLNTEHEWAEDEDGCIDIMAKDTGFHNGPVCVKCGYDKCWHCQSEPSKKCGS